MKLNRSITIFIGALAVGGLFGTGLRTVLFGSMQSDVRSSSSGEITNDSSLLPKRSSRIADTISIDLDAAVVDRFLGLASRAENASQEEMPSLLQLAKLEGHPDLERAIASRWAALDPSHMFQTLMTNGGDDYQLWKVLFKEWAKVDPRGAVEEFANHSDAKFNAGRSGIFMGYLMAHSPAVGVEVASQLEYIDGLKFGMDGVRTWAANDPKAAAVSVAKHMGKSEVGADVMKEIGHVWGARDPEGALTYAESLERDLGSALSKNVMRAWIEYDPEAASAFAAAETDPAKRAKLGEGFAAGLAKTDPESALEWVQENLRSVSRAEAIGDIVRTVAKHDVQAAGDLVAGMDPGGAMNRAASEFMYTWGRHADLSENETMFTWIESLSDTEAQHKAIEAMKWRFSSYSKTGLLDFVSGERGHLATGAMIRDAASQRANEDPASAVAWAQGLPEDRSAQALAAVEGVLKSISANTATILKNAAGSF